MACFCTECPELACPNPPVPSQNSMSDRVCPDPRLSAGQRIALPVQYLVLLVMLLAKRPELRLARPAVDGQVAPRNVSVAEQFRAQVARRCAKQFCPRALRPISRFKARDLIFGNSNCHTTTNIVEPPILMFIVAHGAGAAGLLAMRIVSASRPHPPERRLLSGQPSKQIGNRRKRKQQTQPKQDQRRLRNPSQRHHSSAPAPVQNRPADQPHKNRARRHA